MDMVDVNGLSDFRNSFLKGKCVVCNVPLLFGLRVLSWRNYSRGVGRWEGKMRILNCSIPWSLVNQTFKECSKFCMLIVWLSGQNRTVWIFFCFKDQRWDYYVLLVEEITSHSAAMMNSRIMILITGFITCRWQMKSVHRKTRNEKRKIVLNISGTWKRNVPSAANSRLWPARVVLRAPLLPTRGRTPAHHKSQTSLRDSCNLSVYR